MTRKPILVHGMHGLGDSLHIRALVRQLMATRDVWLETPWPCVFEDLLASGRLYLLNKSSRLRTQAKNAQRERHRYTSHELPRELDRLNVWYRPEDVRRTGSVLGAMCENARLDFARADFRLPIPDAWRIRADRLIDTWKVRKPIMFYRPLVDRVEWGGCPARNPDHGAYAAIMRMLRDRYFVVSVADLVPKVEWLVGEPVAADVECHAGELDFEMLAALAARAGLVYCSPGFAVILAQAVGTPSLCVFGGYEKSTSFSGGARHAPYLGIDPVHPCDCFSHKHACDKRIDLGEAFAAVERFTAMPSVGAAAD